MRFSTIVLSTAIAISLGGAFVMNAQTSSGTSTTVTGVTGTIARLNYNDDGRVEGFLIGTNVLLSFRQRSAVV